MDLMFDVSKTVGREIPAMPVLEEGSPAMEVTAPALLSAAGVNIAIDPSPKKGFTAQYDPAARTIRVAAGLPEHQSFAALAREIAHAELGAS